MDAQGTIDWLRKDGWEVKVEQLRLTEDEHQEVVKHGSTDPHHWSEVMIRGFAMPAWKLREQGVPISPMGGVTRVTAKKDKKTYVGECVCNEVDNFNKRLGLIKATGRLVGSMEKGE